ncbi:MAG: hypothetical protein ACTSXW_01775 [Candidatus Baldrarchaeia archaeon]
MPKRVTIIIPDDLWKKFEEKAIKKFGRYGCIKKAINEAIKLWLGKDDASCD